MLGLPRVSKDLDHGCQIYASNPRAKAKCSSILIHSYSRSLSCTLKIGARSTFDFLSARVLLQLFSSLKKKKESIKVSAT